MGHRASISRVQNFVEEFVFRFLLFSAPPSLSLFLTFFHIPLFLSTFLASLYDTYDTSSLFKRVKPTENGEGGNFVALILWHMFNASCTLMGLCVACSVRWDLSFGSCAPVWPQVEIRQTNDRNLKNLWIQGILSNFPERGIMFESVCRFSLKQGETIKRGDHQKLSSLCLARVYVFKSGMYNSNFVTSGICFLPSYSRLM